MQYAKPEQQNRSCFTVFLKKSLIELCSFFVVFFSSFLSSTKCPHTVLPGNTKSLNWDSAQFFIDSFSERKAQNS